MSLIVYTTSYGSPGDVEHKYLSSPSTLIEWQEKAKEARESKGSFLECISNPREKGKVGGKCLVNLEQVEWIFEGE
jgi:hypothetical protein